MEKLRIAQVAPLHESVPPKYYGGTERVVYHLTEGLVQAGHEVTLFASGDSITSANLVSCNRKALRLDPHISEPLASQANLIELVDELQDKFDLIHFHCDFIHFPLLRHLRTPYVSTVHGRLDQKEVKRLYSRHTEAALVSISRAQRIPLPRQNWFGNVYHGLPEDQYRFTEEPDDYLAFLGRISPEKGLKNALEICQKLDARIKVAAKVDERDARYFEQEIRPILTGPKIEFIGEIGEGEKESFLGNAKALLFPIEWPEPFGMVMIEAMACGCPVLAFSRGSVPEVVVDGVDGIVVNNVEEAVQRFEEISKIKRSSVRESFEKKFSLRQMVGEYENVYFKLLRSDAPETAPESIWEGEMELFL